MSARPWSRPCSASGLRAGSLGVPRLILRDPAAVALLWSQAVTRALASLTLSLPLALGCVASRPPSEVEVPSLTPTANSLQGPEFALPYHSAGIVDLALPQPEPGERWRLVSGDLDGWVRFWADGRMLAASLAHPGGLAALELASDGTLYTAGFDGRVREWPRGATSPSRSFRFGRQVTALAVSDGLLAISDGRSVQLWLRGETPELVWSTKAEAFVTGLSLAAGPGVLVAAELRESAMRDGIATHPRARFEGAGLRAVDAEEAADLAYLAARDFPGAAADFVEVWELAEGRVRQLVPQAPIDADLGIFAGGVVYREIFDRKRAAAIGRRLEDRAHVSLALVKPWALFAGATQDPNAPADPLVNIGDFVVGPGGEIIVVDHFPGWTEAPPQWSWRVGERRELAIGDGFAALGDGFGNLAVVDLAQPSERGWQAAGEEVPKLLASAGASPWIATATLEPRVQVRLWSLDEGVHRALRVEAPGAVIDEAAATRWQVSRSPMYPLALALDDRRSSVAMSMASFEDPAQGAIRVIAGADGRATTLTLAATPHPIELAQSPDATTLLAWTPGYPGFRWTRDEGAAWMPAAAEVPAGAPKISASGAWAAHVSPLERTIVELGSGETRLIAKVEPVVSEFGAPIPAALADDGTLALVEPFGGGVVQLLAIDGSQAAIELPGAATALAWIADRDGRPTLIIGFQDGSIVRVDREVGVAQPIHAGAGGRIWALTPLGGRPGVYLELDERGLAVHRLDDDALLELHLADDSTLARDSSSPPQEPSSRDLVAIWRPGTAMPVCLILDGSSAGALASAGLRRLTPSEAPAMFEAFASGQPCPKQAPAAAIEPMPLE